MPAGDKATNAVKNSYDHVASVYDPSIALLEWTIFRRWRKRLWSKVEGKRILEAGVGTGMNVPYYPAGAEIVAIDLSQKMMEQARKKVQERGLRVEFRQMDVQSLDFPDDSFDTVVATLLFCSVSDPVRGLAEVRRVCKTGGKVLLLEHVRSDNRLMAWNMDLWNHLTIHLGGEHINRRTVENVVRSGLALERVVGELSGIIKLIEARK